MMNPETVSNNIRKNKNDYRKLSKTLKARCGEISKVIVIEVFQFHVNCKILTGYYFQSFRIMMPFHQD